MSVTQLGSWTTGLTHTKQAGSSRVLTFFAHTEHSSATTTPEVSAVTYGDQPLSRVVSGSSEALAVADDPVADFSATVETWYISETSVDAASGSDFTVAWVADPGIPDLVVYTSAFWGGNNQSSPFGSLDTHFDIGSPEVDPIETDMLSTNSGDMVVGGVAAGNDGTYSAGNGFTLGSTLTTTSHTGATEHKLATSSGETPSFQYSDPVEAGSNRQAMVGFVLQALVGESSTRTIQDTASFTDSLDLFNTYTLSVGETGVSDFLENLDRGVNTTGGVDQRVQADELAFTDQLTANIVTDVRSLADTFSFTDAMLRDVVADRLLTDSIVLTDLLSENVVDGDGWVRYGDDVVETWTAATAAAKLWARPRAFVDTFSGVDFVLQIKSDPDWQVRTAQPQKIRTLATIEADAGLEALP
jgi:hypothetical protein